MKITAINHKLLRYSLVFILFFIWGCTTEKGVFHNEMNNQLRVYTEKNELVFITSNSKFHSAFILYDLSLDINSKEKIIRVTAKQGLKKEHKEKFSFDLSKLKISDIQDYRILWINPDNSNVNLQLEKK